MTLYVFHKILIFNIKILIYVSLKYTLQYSYPTRVHLTVSTTLPSLSGYCRNHKFLLVII